MTESLSFISGCILTLCWTSCSVACRAVWKILLMYIYLYIFILCWLSSNQTMNWKYFFVSFLFFIWKEKLFVCSVCSALLFFKCLIFFIQSDREKWRKVCLFHSRLPTVRCVYVMNFCVSIIFLFFFPTIGQFPSS